MAVIVNPKLRLNWWQQTLFLMIFTIVLQVAGVAESVVGVFFWGSSPIKQVWVNGLGGLYKFGQSVQKLPKATRRIQDLESRLVEASASLAELETVKKENRELQLLLTENARLSERTLITSPVIAFAQPAIAAGQEDGVRSGAVVLSKNTLLGQVSLVGLYQSTVVLLFEKESQPILASTDSGVSGLVVGDGKKLLLTEVSKEETLNIGDRVITLGQPQVEKGLPIGKIIKIVNDPVLSVQSAVVEQYVSFFEISIVEVR